MEVRKGFICINLVSTGDVNMSMAWTGIPSLRKSPGYLLQRMLNIRMLLLRDESIFQKYLCSNFGPPVLSKWIYERVLHLGANDPWHLFDFRSSSSSFSAGGSNENDSLTSDFLLEINLAKQHLRTSVQWQVVIPGKGRRKREVL